MSLRNLIVRKIAPPPSKTRQATVNSAIFFSFTSSYLLPFKVMIYSMLRTGTLVDTPIIICSDDPEVFKDKIVEVVCDKPVLLSGTEAEEIYSLSENNVKRPERKEWNRGTFLKWSVFRDYGFPQVLFLDVDMLVLRPLEGLLEELSGNDFVVCPQFHTSLRKSAEGLPLDPIIVEANLRNMISGKFKGSHLYKINSGVMLLGNKSLSRAFKEELFLYAKDNIAVNEQTLISNFIKSSGNYKLKMVSSSFNFQETFLGSIDPVAAFEIGKNISILHYAGKAKPWQQEAGKTTRFTANLWDNYKSSAEKYTTLLQP